MGKRRTPERNPNEDAEAKELREKRERMYEKTYEELVQKQIANSESFDGSLLTLSSAGLGLSLAFITDIVKPEFIVLKPLLIASWGLFAGTILATIFSIMASQAAIKLQMENARKYYLEEDDGYGTALNKWSVWTERFNRSAGVLFVCALVVTICFVSINLLRQPPHEPSQAPKAATPVSNSAPDASSSAPSNSDAPAAQPAASTANSSGPTAN